MPFQAILQKSGATQSAMCCCSTTHCSKGSIHACHDVMFKQLLETAGTTVYKSTCSGNTGGSGGGGGGGSAGGGGSGGEFEVKVATVICDNSG